MPTVDLDDIGVPESGLVIKCPEECKKNFAKSNACRAHYEAIAAARSFGEIVQCPYGFSSVACKTQSQIIALTGFVPYLRQGGAKERRVAKKYPDCKLPESEISRACEILRETEVRIRKLEQEAVERHSMALHEIRKLNRTVKQAAERLCRSGGQFDAANADPAIVKIWKAAELMSAQFEIIEILANESLLDLPLNSDIEFYRLLDKCVRIYNSADKRRIILTTADGYSGRIRACDKTISVVPTTLIENALKYSPNMTTVKVKLQLHGQKCRVSVENETSFDPELDESLFKKETRGRNARAFASEGSGNGLYLAQLVAKQHGTKLEVDTFKIHADRFRSVFRVDFQPNHRT